MGATSGLPPLRPMTTADVLDGGFRLLRSGPAAVLVPSLVLAVVVAVADVGLQLALVPDAASGVRLTGVAVLGLGDLWWRLAALTLGGVATTVDAAFVAAVALALLERPDQRVGLRRAWSLVRPRVPAALALGVVVGVGQTVALALCLVPGVWLWVLWSLAGPAVVVERAGVRRALGRSRTLVGGAFWRVLGLQLLAWLVTVAVGYLFRVPFGLVAGQVASQPTAVALTSLGTLLTSAVVLPLRAAVDVTLYLDQRVRREAFDVVLRLAALPPVGAPVAARVAGGRAA